MILNQKFLRNQILFHHRQKMYPPCQMLLVSLYWSLSYHHLRSIHLSFLIDTVPNSFWTNMLQSLNSYVNKNMKSNLNRKKLDVNFKLKSNSKNSKNNIKKQQGICCLFLEIVIDIFSYHVFLKDWCIIKKIKTI